MKKLFLVAIAVILCLTYCTKNESGPDQDIIAKDTLSDSKNNVDPDIILKIGENLSYKYSDIEMYDSSAHILYFKTNHSEFDDFDYSCIAPFILYVDGDTIYKGDLWPTSYGLKPTGAYIQTCPLKLQNYALLLKKKKKDESDLRNVICIINALENLNLLHSGLMIVTDSLKIKSTQVDFTFTITNKDQSPLLILDPDKMGINLFHYFTNGLSFQLSPEYPFITVGVPHESPSTAWDVNWMTKLDPGSSKTFTFNYPLTTPFDPGEYTVHFDFPGLLNIGQDHLIQDNVRIWLGEVTSTQNIIIE